MTELLIHSSDTAAPPQPRASVRDALQESRQRWRNLVRLAAELAFETDIQGRFVLVVPEDPFGWPAGSLIGRSSEFLLSASGAGINPFCSAGEVRRHRAWLRCGDGGLSMATISATPLRDAAGEIIGTRGIAIDMTAPDAQSAQLANRLRRSQSLHHILSQVVRETDTDSKMDAALWALIHAVGAEGAAVIGGVSEGSDIEVLHECGPGASAVLRAAAYSVTGGASDPIQIINPDGRLVIVAGCETRLGPRTALVIWRVAGAAAWNQEDMALAGSAVCVVRMVAEYEALRRELALQASTDPLTGLLNRRAFVDVMRRETARLDREAEVGTLMFVDVDAFKSVNDRLGHAIGDIVLIKLADMLRGLVRPFDLITRLGGDEFAVWLSGADHMTAAERADHLCKTALADLQTVLPEEFPKLGVSVGIATRRTGSRESLEDLIKRADMAMYEVKRSGRHHWRVSLLDGDR